MLAMSSWDHRKSGGNFGEKTLEHHKKMAAASNGESDLQLSEEETKLILALRQQKTERVRIPFPSYTLFKPEDILHFARQYEPKVTELRHGQYECLKDLMLQNDTIAIIPTGGGKSLIWLLLAVIGIRNDVHNSQPRPLVLVIVPFKSTIQSHVIKYNSWGLSMTSNDSSDSLRSKIECSIWIYCTPEKIVKNDFFKSLISGQAHRIRYVVYDEAHEWLADYRPDLLKCAGVIAEIVPNACLFACTATCSENDIPRLQQRLHIPGKPAVHRGCVDRSNCFLRVVPSTVAEEDMQFIFDQVNHSSKPPTLIFVATKKEAAQVRQHLTNLVSSCSAPNVTVQEIVHFTSETEATEKVRIISKFLEGKIQCVVATQAFGTGVDLPDIRLIIHYCLCPKIATYLQNIGRGGRDGKYYDCILMYSYKMIQDCGKVWCANSTEISDPTDETPSRWKEYLQMVSYPMSLLCRRAYLLPLFDHSFNVNSHCALCDNCIARVAEAPYLDLDVTSAARLLIEAILECTSGTFASSHVQMSRVRDIQRLHHARRPGPSTRCRCCRCR